MEIKVLSSDEWSEFAEMAHKAVFAEIRPSSMNRIDYALVVEKDGVLLQFATIREFDSETAYINYGGSFPSAKGTSLSYLGFKEIIKFLLERYKQITMLVENTNKAMMKLAIKTDFKIIGLRSFKNTILLEHVLFQEV